MRRIAQIGVLFWIVLMVLLPCFGYSFALAVLLGGSVSTIAFVPLVWIKLRLKTASERDLERKRQEAGSLVRVARSLPPGHVNRLFCGGSITDPSKRS